MASVLPGRLDFESYAGDDFAVILAFTEDGVAYELTAGDYTATLKRAGGDVTIAITQESASSLRLAISDTNLGTAVSQDRWELRHTATDRTWLAGDFAVTLNRNAQSGSTTANIVVGTTTYNVTMPSVAVLSGAASDASDVSITDAGGYYTGTDVEAALQEIGNDIDGLATGAGATLEQMRDDLGTSSLVAGVLSLIHI